MTLECESFQAGRISNYLSEWRKITSDPQILSYVTGVEIERKELPQEKESVIQRETRFTEREKSLIEKEISTLLGKKVLEIAKPCVGEVISPIFLTPKPDGSYRMILNLKKFNKQVVYRHFKMDTLNTIVNLMSKDCYMASLDLKDAYYSVPISKKDRKFLRFRFNGKMLQYTSFANGLGCCPRLFTKILKVPLSTLHKAGHITTAYIDDLYIQADTFENCIRNVIETIRLFTKLGFVIHPKKSSFIPSKQLKMLGFILNSETMTVSPTEEKINSVTHLCSQVIQQRRLPIRQVAQVVGKIISCFPGTLYGPLYYRNIEYDKIFALKTHKGNFDALMQISKHSILELRWWVSNSKQFSKPLIVQKPCQTITTDASLNGWGAVCNNEKTGGLWSIAEKSNNINYLEMLAIFFGLKVFAINCTDCHIRIMTDNTTAVSVLTHMGTNHSQSCNPLCKLIWEWCIHRNIWISVAHIPGKLNVDADRESRRAHKSSTEWMINSDILKSCLKKFDLSPNVDLFASRLNRQFQAYVSYTPEPDSFAVDAFTLDWSMYKNYIFPPFSLIPKILRKLLEDQAQAICILPHWPTQAWYSKAMTMMIGSPVILQPSQSLLRLATDSKTVHPLHEKLRLIVCHLSGVK